MIALDMKLRELKFFTRVYKDAINRCLIYGRKYDIEMLLPFYKEQIDEIIKETNVYTIFKDNMNKIFDDER